MNEYIENKNRTFSYWEKLLERNHYAYYEQFTKPPRAGIEQGRQHDVNPANTFAVTKNKAAQRDAVAVEMQPKRMEKTLEHQAEVEAEVHVEEENSSELQNKVQTVKEDPGRAGASSCQYAEVRVCGRQACARRPKK